MCVCFVFSSRNVFKIDHSVYLNVTYSDAATAAVAAVANDPTALIVIVAN